MACKGHRFIFLGLGLSPDTITAEEKQIKAGKKYRHAPAMAAIRKSTPDMMLNAMIQFSRVMLLMNFQILPIIPINAIYYYTINR